MTRVCGVLVVLMAGAVACTPRGSASRASNASAETETAPTHLRVTVVDAAIASTRADGSPWHVNPGKHTWKAIATAAGLVAGQAELGAVAGALLDKPDRVIGPAPFVTLSVNGRTYETSALESSLNPKWDEDILVDLAGVATTDPVIVMVRDGIDGSVIGQSTLTVGSLRSREGHTVAMGSDVLALNFLVRDAHPRRRSGSVQVSSGASIAVALEGGDTVELDAVGSVCVRPDRCFGPAGDPNFEDGYTLDDLARPRPRGQSDNYNEFLWAPNGSLVALFDGQPISIGPSTRLRVPRAGQLLLLVNDANAADNNGFFDVSVQVNSALSP